MILESWKDKNEKNVDQINITEEHLNFILGVALVKLRLISCINVILIYHYLYIRKKIKSSSLSLFPIVWLNSILNASLLMD